MSSRRTLVLRDYNRSMGKKLDNIGSISAVLTTLVLVVAASGVVFYGTYSWQQREVTSLNKQIMSKNLQIATLKTQNVQNSTTVTSEKGIKIKLYTPTSGSLVASPTAVLGEIPGNWSFEASFPVKLLDSNGTVIVQTPAQLIGDWTTDKYVPFSVKLIYSAQASGSGTLVLQKDNPSGLPANDDSVTIPVRF